MFEMRRPLPWLGKALGPLAIGSSSLVSFACASEGVDLGGGRLAQDLSRGSRCLDSTVLDGDVRVTSQEEVAALEGCEEIRGELNVQLFADADLSPLHALRVVDSTLVLGSSAQALLSPDELSDPELVQQIEERELALRGQWLSSLAGLESLEIIGGLGVFETAITDLLPLAGLRSIGRSVSGTLSSGEIYFFGNPRLRDMTGLDGASGVQQLELVDNAALQSLDGFAPEPVFEVLNVFNCPALADIDALMAVTGIQIVNLENTGVTDLNALSALEGAFDSLYVIDNVSLVDASGLGNVRESRSVLFQGNTALRILPSFSSYDFAPDLIIIRDNPELEEVDLDLRLALASSVEVGDEFQPLSMDFISVSNNAKVRSVTFAPFVSDVFGLHAAQIVRLDQNPSLTLLDFGGFERADVLFIDQNPALTEVILGSLATVDTLEITDNPSLDASVFDPVRTFERISTGNANDLAP
jgi:hypothetical protein